MRKSKWMSAIFILLAALLLASACSSKNNEGTASSESPSASNTSAAPSESPTPAPLAPATFKMNTTNPLINWDNDVAKAITANTGVTMEWDIVTGDNTQRLNIWLAGGDYPDLVNLRDPELKSYKDANALVELTDLIQQHGPNILAAYNNDLKPLQDENGKVWALRAPPAKDIKNLGDKGWISIQAAVLADAGWPQIKTLDDVYNVVSSYAKKYPEISGGKTIGFSNFGNDNMLFNIFHTAAMGYAGLANFGPIAIDENKVAGMSFFQPHYTDLLKFFNKMNKEGLFDPESLLQNEEQFSAKCTQGRVLAVFGPGWASGCTSGLNKGGMADRGYVTFDIVTDGVTKLTGAVTQATLNGTDFWVGITKNAKDPVRAVQFFNQMFEQKNQLLVNWGVEGKYYNVENGKRVVTDWLLKEFTTGDDGWERTGMVYSRPLLGIMTGGAIGDDGDFAKYEFSESFIQSGLSKEILDALSHYNATTFADLMAPAKAVDFNFSNTFFTDEMKAFTKEAIAAWGQSLASYILEKDESKLDGIWSDLEKNLKNRGLDKFVADVNAGYQKLLQGQ